MAVAGMGWVLALAGAAMGAAARPEPASRCGGWGDGWAHEAAISWKQCCLFCQPDMLVIAWLSCATLVLSTYACFITACLSDVQCGGEGHWSRWVVAAWLPA